MELKSPKRKGFKAPPSLSPLPICYDGPFTVCADEYSWPIFTGRFIGNQVIVEDFNEGINLSKKGCFGKGTLSKCSPNTGKRRALLSVLSESQWKRRKLWDDLLNQCFTEENSSAFDEKNVSENDQNMEDVSDENKMDVDNKTPEGNSKTIELTDKEDIKKELVQAELKSNEVLVIADLDNNIDEYLLNLNPRIEVEKYRTDIEVLHLSLEEAFFLSYALNCLSVCDLNFKYFTVNEMWILFQQAKPDFIEKYVAYHYFKAKGWVVKPGIKFGGDFLLYKKGPQFFHASYIVVVETFNPDGSMCSDSTTLSWKKSVAVNRMAESATKEVLVCQVMKPDVPKEQFLDPDILKEFKVDEILLRRWQATSEKEKESH